MSNMEYQIGMAITYHAWCYLWLNYKQNDAVPRDISDAIRIIAQARGRIKTESEQASGQIYGS